MRFEKVINSKNIQIHIMS